MSTGWSTTVRDALAAVAGERVHLVHQLLLTALETEGLLHQTPGGTVLSPVGRRLLRHLEGEPDLPGIG